MVHGTGESMKFENAKQEDEMEKKLTHITDWDIDGNGNFTEVEISYYVHCDGSISVDSVIDTKTGEHYDPDDVNCSQLPKEQ